MRSKWRWLFVMLGVLAVAGCNDDDDDDDDDDVSDAKCDEFVDVATDCFDDYCQGAGASVAFCGCWNSGQDLNTQTCQCMPLNLEQACGSIDLDDFDPSLYACQTATTIVSSFCN
jgi:hypothetical protein